jgi:hypothetical protein
MRVYQFRHVGTDTATNNNFYNYYLLLKLKRRNLELRSRRNGDANFCYSRETHEQLRPVEWCPRRDSNPHTLRHMDLNHARLPIPPRGHCYCNYKPASPPTSAIILVFGVLRQINFRYSSLLTANQSAAFFFRCRHARRERPKL